MVYQHPRDVLNEEVVGVLAFQVDVKEQCQQAGHRHLASRQLGHRNVQCVGGGGLVAIESDAFGSAGDLSWPAWPCAV